MWQREPGAHLPDFLADLGADRLIAVRAQHPVKHLRDLLHLHFDHAPRREGGRPQSQAAGDHGFPGIVGDAVLVDDDSGGLQPTLGVGPGEVLVAGAQVHKHEMVVGAARIFPDFLLLLSNPRGKIAFRIIRIINTYCLFCLEIV